MLDKQLFASNLMMHAGQSLCERSRVGPGPERWRENAGGWNAETGIPYGTIDTARLTT